jgi:hypothetical protein
MYNATQFLVSRLAFVAFAILVYLFSGGVAKADEVITTTSGTSYINAFCQLTPPYTDIAQSFTPTADGSISSLLVNVGYNNNGTPDGDMQISVAEDSSGNPGTVLGSGTVYTYTLPSDGTTDDHTISLSPAVSVTAGTTYWIVYSCGDATPSGTHPFETGGVTPSESGFSFSKYYPTTWTSADMTARAVISTVSGGTPTTTPSTIGTTTVIMDPNRDFFNGILLFMGGMTFMIWLFRKRK